MQKIQRCDNHSNTSRPQSLRLRYRRPSRSQALHQPRHSISTLRWKPPGVTTTADLTRHANHPRTLSSQDPKTATQSNPQHPLPSNTHHHLSTRNLPRPGVLLLPGRTSTSTARRRSSNVRSDETDPRCRPTGLSLRSLPLELFWKMHMWRCMMWSFKMKGCFQVD